MHVVIIGEGIPADKSTRTAKFLGVTAHNISFENGYPLLYINKKVYDLMLFPKDEAKWSTTYFTGLDEKTGYLYDNNTKIHFMGSSKNSNITFIGLNLPYHYMKTRDNETLSILSDAYGNCLNKAPRTNIVPLSVTYENRAIKITSDDDKVNTGIAYQDNYSSEDIDNNQDSNESTKINKKDKAKIREIFNLVEVDRGKTIITLHYPMLVQGLILSILALAATIVFTMREKKNKS